MLSKTLVILAAVLMLCTAVHAQRRAKALAEPTVSVELTISAKDNCPPDKQFVGPKLVVSDSKGNIFMMDYVLVKIWKFDANGRFLTVFGDRGEGKGEFIRPDQMLVTSRDDIVVFDGVLKRVSIFNDDGELHKTFKVGISLPHLEMHGVITPQDELIIAGYKDGKTLHVYDLDGNFKRYFGELVTVKRVSISPAEHAIYFVPKPLALANGILYCTQDLEPEILRYDIASGKLLDVTRLEFAHWHNPEITILKSGGGWIADGTSNVDRAFVDGAERLLVNWIDRFQTISYESVVQVYDKNLKLLRSDTFDFTILHKDTAGRFYVFPKRQPWRVQRVRIGW